MKSEFILRPSVEQDVLAITKIYAHWVCTTPFSFEIDPPDAAEIGERRTNILAKKLPYVVAESGDEVMGYAYATLYRPRVAYRFTVENSLYLHPDHLRKGVGRRLLTALISECEELGYRQMIAVIGGQSNLASVGLHQACGFTHAGVLSSVGFKFGKWEDSILMQRRLGPGNISLPKD